MWVLQATPPELVAAIVRSDPLTAIVFAVGVVLLGGTLLVGGLLAFGSLVEFFTPS